MPTSPACSESSESLPDVSGPPGHAGIRSEIGRERSRWAFLPLFVAGSFAVHGVAYAALSGVRTSDVARRPPTLEVEVAVIAPEPVVMPEPLAPVPEQLPVPVPRAVPKVRPPAEPVSAAPEPVAEEPAPLQALGITADEGLQVAGQVGVGNAGAGSLTGSVEGVIGKSGAVAAPVAAPAIDLRKLTSEWASRVSLAIGTRAVHAYPRSALRAYVEGTVLLTVRVGTEGQIEAVDLARSSGFPQLDEAALAAARELGAVPAPPAALHRYLRPFPVPVNYVIRG